MGEVAFIKLAATVLSAIALGFAPHKEVALGVVYPLGGYTLLEGYGGGDLGFYGAWRLSTPSIGPVFEGRFALKGGPCYLGASTEGRVFLECRVALGGE
ncbi:hypothetical protein MN1_140 [Thermus phage MN1]|nr:hypothetical protein MN1_140 [Thermus phage MN1]